MYTFRPWCYDTAHYSWCLLSSDESFSCWNLIWSKENDVKKTENDWNSGQWVLIWEYSVRAIQWIPTRQGLDGFPKSLYPCASDERRLSLGRVKAKRQRPDTWQATTAYWDCFVMAVFAFPPLTRRWQCRNVDHVLVVIKYPDHNGAIIGAV